jgi:hypothetical protein
MNVTQVSSALHESPPEGAYWSRHRRTSNASATPSCAATATTATPRELQIHLTDERATPEAYEACGFAATHRTYGIFLVIVELTEECWDVVEPLPQEASDV